MGNAINIVVQILTAIVVIAILGVILSKKSSTVSVINTFSQAMNTLIGKVVAPIT